MSENSEGNGTVAHDQRLAQWVVRPLARTPITPNMVTTAVLLAGLGAGWLFSRGDWASAAWGGALFMVATWMDHLDGELARATGRTSRFGHHYDNVAMMTTDVAAFVGMGLGLAAAGRGDGYIAIGAVAGVAVAVIFGIRMWAERRLGSEFVTAKPVVGFEVEDTLYVIGPVAWLGLIEPFVIAAAIGAPLFLLWTAWQIVAATRRDTRSATR